METKKKIAELNYPFFIKDNCHAYAVFSKNHYVVVNHGFISIGSDNHMSVESHKSQTTDTAIIVAKHLLDESSEKITSFDFNATMDLVVAHLMIAAQNLRVIIDPINAN